MKIVEVKSLYELFLLRGFFESDDMEIPELLNGFRNISEGLLVITVFCSICSIVFVHKLATVFRGVIKPIVETTFYDTILHNYFGPFFQNIK